MRLCFIINKTIIIFDKRSFPWKMYRNILRIRTCIQSRRMFSSKTEPSENEPIKFSSSPAATKTVKPVLKKVVTYMPWYQPYSVVGSVAIFLLYFCIFREENDIDVEFNKTLYQRIKGLEKQQLLQSYKFNKEHGMSVADIETRLKELEAQEATPASL